MTEGMGEREGNGPHESGQACNTKWQLFLVIAEITIQIQTTTIAAPHFPVVTDTPCFCSIFVMFKSNITIAPCSVPRGSHAPVLSPARVTPTQNLRPSGTGSPRTDGGNDTALKCILHKVLHPKRKRCSYQVGSTGRTNMHLCPNPSCPQ